jgi:16S rRNA (uracil1498-N3)-methyltransferase
VVPAIHSAAPFDWYLNEKAEAARVLCVEPSATIGDVRPVQAIPRSSAVDLIVGPEGGWSVTEVASALDSGAILMSLGGRTLRADAVPIIALTALLTTWGELK